MTETERHLGLTAVEAERIRLVHGGASSALLQILLEGLSEALSDPRAIRSWLERPHPLLLARPLDLLCSSRAREVCAVVFPPELDG